MDKNPSWFSRDGLGKDIEDEDLKHFPVEKASWEDCQEFIKKLNEQEKGKGWVYRYGVGHARLPSEAEWEYACRGGATSEEECSYHFYFAKPTNDLSSKEANFDGNFPYGKADKGPYLERPTKVSSYPSNKLGLYDMHGNVWQWCADLYDPKETEGGLAPGDRDRGQRRRSRVCGPHPRENTADCSGAKTCRVPGPNGFSARPGSRGRSGTECVREGRVRFGVSAFRVPGAMRPQSSEGRMDEKDFFPQPGRSYLHSHRYRSIIPPSHPTRYSSPPRSLPCRSRS
jgi:formylglycine-generating enzyme required for sulfatase activity